MNPLDRHQAAQAVQHAIEREQDCRAVLAAAQAQAHAALRDSDHDAHAATAGMVLAARRAYVLAVRVRLDARAAEVTAWEGLAHELAAQTIGAEPDVRREVAALLIDVACDREAIERERAAWLRVRR